MEVFYNGNMLKNNQFLSVSETQVEPGIKLTTNPNKLYILILYDPDAVGGIYIHWLKTNVTNNDIKTGNVIIPYKGPAPPPKTGKHRYIFNLYEQNGENKIISIERKVIELRDLKNKLKLDDPIYKIKFISENESGGSRTRNKKLRKQSKKNRKTKRRY